MSVTYTRRQRAKAQEYGLSLASIHVMNLTVQGPISKELADELYDFTVEFIKKRQAWMSRNDYAPDDGDCE